MDVHYFDWKIIIDFDYLHFTIKYCIRNSKINFNDYLKSDLIN